MIVSESCISLNKTTTYKFGKKGKHNRGSSEPNGTQMVNCEFLEKKA